MIYLLIFGYSGSLTTMKLLPDSARKTNIVEAVDWAKNFPYAAMVKLGWVPVTRKIEEKAEELLNYFQISKASSWDSLYLQEKLPLYLRISLKHAKDPYALSAWLVHGQKVASEMEAPDYDKKELEKCLPLLKDIMAKQPDNFYHKIQSVCLRAGVKIVFTPLLPKTVINGAVRWSGKNPLVQVSDRYKRYDIFWFSLFHELGHVLLHGNKKNIFIEDISGIDQSDQKEQEANDLAIKWTLTDEEYQEIFDTINVGADIATTVNLYAKKYATHQDMIIGRLLRRNEGFTNTISEPI